MRTGLRFATWTMLGVLCLGVSSFATTQKQKKAKKPDLPPLPSGPTGRPVQQVPLDSIPAVAPQVTYKDGQLTIVAPNSTLSDILRAVHKQTGAEIEIPDAKERVVTNLGPGLARDVVAQLLNGSRFNYILLGSPSDATLLTRVVLVPKSGPDSGVGGGMQTAVNPGGVNVPVVAGNPPQQDPNMAADADDASDENGDDAEQNAAAPAEADQQQPAGQDQAVKTPQQILQEMQQRQLQLQQQQQQQQQQGQGVPPANNPPAQPPGSQRPPAEQQ